MTDRQHHAWARWARYGIVVVVSMTASGCSLVNRHRAEQRTEEGLRLLEADDLDAALVEFRDALALDPRSGVAHSRLGEIYRRQGNYEEAAEHLAEAVKINPSSYEDTFGLAQVYHLMSRLREAVKAYLHACDLAPDSFEGHLNLGVCYHQLGEMD